MKVLVTVETDFFPHGMGMTVTSLKLLLFITRKGVWAVWCQKCNQTVRTGKGKCFS